MENFNIVLVQPEIPQNTGNIGRLCVGTNSNLHLVKPLGFDLDEKKVRRAGLDYWPHLNLTVHDSWIPSAQRCFLFSKKASRSVFEHEFMLGDHLVFGCETRGLPEAWFEQYPDKMLSLPQFGPVRSQNLSNAVAAVVYLGLKNLVDQNKIVHPKVDNAS